MRKSPHLKGIQQKHWQVVIRRDGALTAIRAQLTDRRGNPLFNDRADTRVVYASPLVDVAANMELVRETIELCKTILELTHWQIRLLSKSTFLPFVAQGLEQFPNLRAAQRVIYGVSTGTRDNKLASAIEQGCPLVGRRIESLHRLQDSGFRTFGMICPSLPHQDLTEFSSNILSATHLDSLTSSVTTSWGVDWNEIYIARDLMQNFFDANREQLSKIQVLVEGTKVTLSGPSKFELARLFYLGSEKGDGDIGQYGEGFKAAAVCLLRDHGIEAIAVSGDQVVYLRVDSEKISGTQLHPVVYDFFRSPRSATARV